MNRDDVLISTTAERLCDYLSDDAARSLLTVTETPRSLWDDVCIWVEFAQFLLTDQTYGMIKYAFADETRQAILDTVALLIRESKSEVRWRSMREELRAMQAKFPTGLYPREVMEIQMDEAPEFRRIYNSLTATREYIGHKMDPSHQAHLAAIEATQWALATMDAPYKAGWFVFTCAGAESCLGDSDKTMRKYCYQYAEKLKDFIAGASRGTGKKV